MNDDYEIRPFRPGDEESLLETYAEVFGGRGRTRAEWAWAFERNPAGRRVWVATHGGRVVAQYAALPARMRVGGRDCTGLQVVDSMVHPAHRSGARQPGLFVRTARAFVEACGGPEREPLHYGWPVERAWRVGRRLLDYEVVRAQNAMVADLDGLIGGRAGGALPAGVRAVRSFGPRFDGLGFRCAARVGATALRSGAWLDWRFADHPARAYRALALEQHAGLPGSAEAGEPAGLAVWTRADLGIPDLALLVEWLVPEGDVEAGAALLEAVALEARAAGLRTLALWCPEWSAWCAELQERGFLVQPTDYLTTARSWWRAADLPWLRDHWWYQLSDTDLV